MKQRWLITVPAVMSAMVLSASAALAAPTAKVERATTSVGSCAHGAATLEDRAVAPAKTGHSDHGKHLGQAKHEQGSGEDRGDESDAGQGNEQRPQNHGWFVSQAAKDHSVTGRAHGEAV